MTQTTLEERAYECNSKDHSGNEKTLDHLKYFIGGSPSIYYFCEPCKSLYSIDDKQNLTYVSEDDLENIPTLLDKYGKEFEPADLLGDEEC